MSSSANMTETFLPASASAKRTLSEQALSMLYERIMSGELPPGHPLRLLELAADLGMSPSPVREGLRRLENMGLVLIEANKGAYVRPVSMEDFEDTYRTRQAIEAMAIELAAERFSADDASAAREALDDHRKFELTGQRLEARMAHTRFHFTLYRASRSTWLLRAIEPVWENSERYRFTTEADAQHRSQSDNEHEAILQACTDHDVAGAVLALHSHVQRASDRMRVSLLPKLNYANSGPELGEPVNEKIEEH